MFSTFFSMLGFRSRRGTVSRSRKHGPKRRAATRRFRLESLERRELFSAAPLAAIPSPGNLSISGVFSESAVGGNGVPTAHFSTPYGTYNLDFSGNLKITSPNGQTSQTVPNVVAVTPDQTGHDVFWLTNAGTLYESVNGVALPSVDAGVESFALANNARGFVDLTDSGVLQEGYADTHGISGVQSFQVGNGGRDIYWLDNSGNLYQSVNGSAAQWVDGSVESFALANNARGFVDLTNLGVLREGYGSAALAPAAQSGVQSFAVGGGGQDVFWLTSGGLYESANGAGAQWLDGSVESFALANNASGFVDLTDSGVLREGSNGTVLATSGVESFAVGNGGQDVYWLTTGGALNQSINGGSANVMNVGIESFAMAEQGMALVVQFANGSLQEGEPGAGAATLARSGVQSFAVGNGSQDVYWLTRGGALNQSINGGSGGLLSGGIEKFAMGDQGMALVVEFANGRHKQGSSGVKVTTRAGTATLPVSDPSGSSVFCEWSRRTTISTRPAGGSSSSIALNAFSIASNKG